MRTQLYTGLFPPSPYVQSSYQSKHPRGWPLKWTETTILLHQPPFPTMISARRCSVSGRRQRATNVRHWTVGVTYGESFLPSFHRSNKLHRHLLPVASTSGYIAVGVSTFDLPPPILLPHIPLSSLGPSLPPSSLYYNQVFTKNTCISLRV